MTESPYGLNLLGSVLLDEFKQRFSAKGRRPMTKKNTTPTIILELTPREAAVIYTVAWTANHLEGDYREECKAIAEALEDVSYAHDKHVALMVNRGGFRMGGSFWFIDEANEDESFHPYSGA